VYSLLQGQYRTVFEKTYTCESTNLIQFNLYFSKKTFNITEMKGNLTFLVPLDDTLTVSIMYILKIINIISTCVPTEIYYLVQL